MSEILNLKIPLTDDEFDAVLPIHIRKLSNRHFTNLEVSREVSQRLNEYKDLNLLDLGCGIGKFCVVVASITKHNITGIDFRHDYILIAKRFKDKYNLKNLNFINQNILKVNFKTFNAFYLFNPFLEQIDNTARMDDDYETSPLLYSIYENHVRQELQKMPAGTIVITYYVNPQQMPFNYEISQTSFDGFLKIWTKK